MTRISQICGIAAFACFSTAASADVVIRFQESAPRDRFIIENVGACARGPMEIIIDMSGTAGGLYFDTTGAGAGVEVFQPFRKAEGSLELLSGDVLDGDTELRLRVVDLPASERAAFTIDVDDRLANSDMRQTMISGAEIAGGEIYAARLGGATVSAKFDESSTAVLKLGDCPSS
ncbi:MAG: aggregation factor core [Pseudomonadota bacterium]